MTGPAQSSSSGNRGSSQPQQQQPQQQQTRGGRGSGRSKNTSSGSGGGGHQLNSSNSNCSSSNLAETSTQQPPSKRSQRGKRGHRGQKQGKCRQMPLLIVRSSNAFSPAEDLSGIPHNMGYFNPNEVAIPPPLPPHSGSYASTLAQQMQHLRIGSSSSSSSSKQQQQQQPNCSIMDQLNRGVQVEHLSLPPGITLTKVDPAKSEQLRQKSESIRKLSKPLAEQQQQQLQHQQQVVHTLQQPAHLMGSYYAGNAGLMDTAGIGGGGVIMVEANPRSNRNCQQLPVAVSNSNVAAAAAAATASGKSSRRRRRNRGKSGGNGGGGGGSSSAKRSGGTDGQQTQLSSVPIMEASAGGNIITLRNPMFHQGGGGVGVNNGPLPSSASMLSNPNPIPPGKRQYRHRNYPWITSFFFSLFLASSCLWSWFAPCRTDANGSAGRNY